MEEARIEALRHKAMALSFEEAMEALQETVAQLEEEQLPLEEAEALYLWGRILAAHCQRLLDEAELRLETLDDAAFV